MDIALYFQQGQTPFADIVIVPPGLEINQDLFNAVFISLFCNRLAESGDPIDGTDRQGWWGDSYAMVNGSLIGSRLWELRRQKTLLSVAALAQQYCLEALQWLVDDQVVESIAVQAEISALYTLKIFVQLYKPNQNQNFKYTYVWNQL